MRKQFKNPHAGDIKKTLWDILLWQIGGFRDSLPPPVPPKDFVYPNPRANLNTEEPMVHWVNHCTFLLSIDGVNILTDPIWSKRCSPVPFFGPKRCHQPSIALNKLPPIHMVLISHDHYDHLDDYTVCYLNKKFPDIEWVVPKGLKSWFKKRGMKRVTEHLWWQQSEYHPKENGPLFQVTAVPTQHFSGRSGWHSNETLWVGYMVDVKRLNGEEKRFYFVGDTGYNDVDFKKIGEQFDSIDLSMIPIGTYVPHDFMSPVHISPDRAVAIHKEVNSKLSVGMHWKTFKLSSEGMEQPPYDLFLALKEENLNPLHFRVLSPGQEINW